MKKKCKNCAYYRRSLFGLEYCVVGVPKVRLEERRKRYEIMCNRFIFLKKGERKELLEKTRSLEERIKSRWGKGYVEGNQRQINIIESILEHHKSLSPETKEKSYALLKVLKKREFDKRKTPKRVCLNMPDKEHKKRTLQLTVIIFMLLVFLNVISWIYALIDGNYDIALSILILSVIIIMAGITLFIIKAAERISHTQVFPLLRKLPEVGDKNAWILSKEETAKKYRRNRKLYNREGN